MVPRRLIRPALLSVLLFTFVSGAPTWTAAQQIPSPEEYFGFQM